MNKLDEKRQREIDEAKAKLDGADKVRLVFPNNIAYCLYQNCHGAVLHLVCGCNQMHILYT